MYEDLIKRLRDVSMYFGQFDYVSVLLLEAADAIEVLSKKEKTTKPHGRLIDADQLKEQLEYVASLEWNQRVGASPGIECAIDMLDDAQTIISAEVGET